MQDELGQEWDFSSYPGIGKRTLPYPFLPVVFERETAPNDPEKHIDMSPVIEIDDISDQRVTCEDNPGDH